MIQILFFHRAFRVLAHVFQYEFQELGLESQIYHSKNVNDCVLNSDDICLILAYQSCSENIYTKITESQCKLIIFNAEPLPVWLKGRHSAKIKRYLKLADVVWCHAKNDVPIVRKLGVADVKFLAIGYSKKFELCDLNDKSKYSSPQPNIIWMGQKTPARTQSLKYLQRVKQVGIWDDPGYTEIFSENYLFLSLNAHPSLYKYAGPLRILPILSNKCLLIAQKIDDPVFQPLVISCDNLEELKQQMNYYLDHPEKAQEKIEEIYHWAKENFSMKDQLLQSGCASDLGYVEK